MLSTQHNQSIDTMKVLAIIAVICIHATAAVTFTFDLSSRADWWFANSISSLSRFCVPIFIMCSGALFLNSGKKQTTKIFLVKRAKRLLIPLIIWTLFYCIWNYYFRSDPLNFWYTIRRILFDQPYEHLYFLYIMLELAIITPLLQQLRHKTSNTQFNLITIFFLVITIFWVPRRFIGLLAVPYIGYYLLGSVLFSQTIRVAKKYLFCIFSLATLTVLFGTFLLVSHTIKNNDGLYFYTFTNPAVLLMSIAFFLFFKQSTLQLRDAKLSFGIYLVHPVFLFLFRHIFGAVKLPYFFEIVLVIACTYFASAFIVNLYQKLPTYNHDSNLGQIPNKQ